MWLGMVAVFSGWLLDRNQDGHHPPCDLLVSMGRLLLSNRSVGHIVLTAELTIGTS